MLTENLKIFGITKKKKKLFAMSTGRLGYVHPYFGIVHMPMRVYFVVKMEEVDLS